MLRHSPLSVVYLTHVLGLVMLVFSGDWMLLNQQISYPTFIAYALHNCVGAGAGPVGPIKLSVTLFISHYGHLNSRNQSHSKERLKSYILQK
jgi:hypothetical protein